MRLTARPGKMGKEVWSMERVGWAGPMGIRTTRLRMREIGKGRVDES